VSKKTKRAAPKPAKDPCPSCGTHLTHLATSRCATDAHKAGVRARAAHPDRDAMALIARAWLTRWAGAPRWAREDVAGHYTRGSAAQAATGTGRRAA
jgi:hypothetical protein